MRGANLKISMDRLYHTLRLYAFVVFDRIVQFETDLIN